MLKVRTILGLLVGGILIVGCKKETPAPAPVPQSHPEAPAPAPAPTVTPATPGAPTNALPITPAPAPQNPTSLPSLPPDNPPVTTTTPVTGTSASPTDAKGLLAEVNKNVEAKKWDAAESDLKKLTAMKDTLSPEMQKEVDDAEAKFVANKAASNLKLPGLGGTTPDTAPVEPNK